MAAGVPEAVQMLEAYAALNVRHRAERNKRFTDGCDQKKFGGQPG